MKMIIHSDANKTHFHKKDLALGFVLTYLLEETGYKGQQTLNIKKRCSSLCWKLTEGAQILCFLLANCDGINLRDDFIGQ